MLDTSRYNQERMEGGREGGREEERQEMPWRYAKDTPFLHESDGNKSEKKVWRVSSQS